jgi:hypothetical protein
MFGEERHDAIVRRSLDEALACQDMLERTPGTGNHAPDDPCRPEHHG